MCRDGMVEWVKHAKNTNYLLSEKGLIRSLKTEVRQGFNRTNESQVSPNIYFARHERVTDYVNEYTIS